MVWRSHRDPAARPRRTAHPASSRRPTAPRASATVTPARLATRSSSVGTRRERASRTRSRHRVERVLTPGSAIVGGAGGVRRGHEAGADDPASSRTSAASVTHTATPSRSSRWQPADAIDVTGPGHGADGPQQPRRMVRGAHRARTPRGLDHHRGPTGRGDQPVPLQEPALGRQAARWHLRHERSPGPHHRVQQSRVPRRIGPVDTAREDHERSARRARRLRGAPPRRCRTRRPRPRTRPPPSVRRRGRTRRAPRRTSPPATRRRPPTARARAPRSGSPRTHRQNGASAPRSSSADGHRGSPGTSSVPPQPVEVLEVAARVAVGQPDGPPRDGLGDPSPVGVGERAVPFLEPGEVGPAPDGRADPLEGVRRPRAVPRASRRRRHPAPPGRSTSRGPARSAPSPLMRRSPASAAGGRAPRRRARAPPAPPGPPRSTRRAAPGPPRAGSGCRDRARGPGPRPGVRSGPSRSRSQLPGTSPLVRHGVPTSRCAWAARACEHPRGDDRADDSPAPAPARRRAQLDLQVHPVQQRTRQLAEVPAALLAAARAREPLADRLSARARVRGEDELEPGRVAGRPAQPGGAPARRAPAAAAASAAPRVENSGASSRNRTPRCAREAAPGRGTPDPPPTTLAGVAVWCGSSNGGPTQQAVAGVERARPPSAPP